MRLADWKREPPTALSDLNRKSPTAPTPTPNWTRDSRHKRFHHLPNTDKRECLVDGKAVFLAHDLALGKSIFGHVPLQLAIRAMGILIPMQIAMIANPC